MILYIYIYIYIYIHIYLLWNIQLKGHFVIIIFSFIFYYRYWNNCITIFTILKSYIKSAHYSLSVKHLTDPKKTSDINCSEVLRVYFTLVCVCVYLYIDSWPAMTGYSKCSAAGSRFTTCTDRLRAWQCSNIVAQYVLWKKGNNSDLIQKPLTLYLIVSNDIDGSSIVLK